MKRTMFKVFLVVLMFSMFACSSSSDGDTSTDGDGAVDGDGDNASGDIDDSDGDAESTDGDSDSSTEGDNDEGLTTPGLASGAFSLQYSAEEGMLLLNSGDKTLMRWGLDSIQLGIVEEVDDEVNYDPFPLTQDDPFYTPPEGLAWLNIETAELKENTSTTLVLDLAYEQEKKATLTIELSHPGSFSATLIPAESSTQIAYFRLRPRVDSEEAFYGLGEYFDDVNHRGKIRAMQLEAAGDLESGYNEAHVPVPFVIGTTGWGLFAECPYPGIFELANKEDDLVEVTFGMGPFSNDGFVFHIFAEDHPLDLTRHYYEITGFPTLPARWALGPWIWRDESTDQAEVISDLDTIRELDLATTAYWIDRPYASGVNAFDFDTNKFNDAQGMIDYAHGLGFRMALWHTPYMANGNESSETTIEYYNYADENGYFPPVTGLLLNKWGKPMDFTNPDAYDWWQSLISNYTTMGIEGFKLDYAEDVVPGVFGARNKWKFFDGSDERSMKSRYQIFYHKVYAEMLPEDGGFLLCRGGTYGDQKYAGVIWPGDLDSSFSYHGEESQDWEGETYLAVGGLPAAIIASQTLGPSGFPYFGSDTGGYRHCPPDKELFTRWFQHTALSSVMQIGTSCNDVAWEGDSQNLFDEEMLTWYAAYTRLHLRLFAYEWTYSQNLLKDGRPIQRSLGLAYPELGEHPFDQYMFGSDLMVAPVYRQGVTERDIILPAGRWADWWTGEVYEGGTTLASFAAPLDKLPLFIRESGIVPLLRPTIDTISPTTDQEKVDSYASDAGMIYPVILPGPASEFTLFDGCRITQEQSENDLLLSYADGEEFVKGAVFQIIAVEEKPATVSDNESALSEKDSMSELEAAESGWFYDGDAKMLNIKVAGGNHSVSVE